MPADMARNEWTGMVDLSRTRRQSVSAPPAIASPLWVAIRDLPRGGHEDVPSDGQPSHRL